MNVRGIATAAAMTVAAMALTVQAQSFGMAKTKVTLQRKLPAVMPVEGDSIRVRVTAHGDATNLAQDLQSQLETELLKDDSKLHEEDTNPSTSVTVEITNVSRIQRTTTQKSNPMAGKNGPKTVPYTRITASLSLAFQAKGRTGRVLGSDNVTVNYDQEFDANGNNTSHGVLGTLDSGWHKIKGGSSENQDDQPPSDGELRTKLLGIAVQRMASQIVNTDEKIDVFLAKNKGAIDEGDKQAEAGLWERALETFETASPLSKKDEDAYRLYNIGVANEALGYAAEDPKSAMKFLDEAAINYGKAIDDKPGEKYFLEPQKRIETALAHYRKLETAKNAPPPAPPAAPAATAPPAAAPAPTAAAGAGTKTKKPASAPTKTPAASTKSAAATTSNGTNHRTKSGSTALTDSQVIAMVKSGIADEMVEQTVKTAKAVDFDLSSAGQHRLTAGGVSSEVLSAMKVRAAQDLASGK
jgi:hypothetical protein